MARKLSVLEVLLIVFNIVVLAVDILLLLLVLEDSPGKGDGGCLEDGQSKSSLDARDTILFIHHHPISSYLKSVSMISLSHSSR